MSIPGTGTTTTNMLVAPSQQDFPLILNGTFLKIKNADLKSGKFSAICVICEPKTTSTDSSSSKTHKPRKIINGSIRPTSNFTSHLKTCHPDEYKKYQELMKDPSNKLKNFNQAKLPFSISKTSGQFTRTERLVTDYIIESMSPLSTVDCPSFKALISGLSDGNHKVPDRKRLMTVIHDRYNKKISRLKEIANNAEFYCVTTDIWSSRHRSFLGMTLHWLNDDLQRGSAVIAIKRFIGTPNFDKITEQILEIFFQYGLDNEKITCVVTDNGSNFVKAFCEYGVNFENPSFQDDDGENEEQIETDLSASLLPAHQSCASHTLSLIATTDLDKANIVTPRGNGSINFKRVFRCALAKCTSVWNVTSRSVKINDEIVKLCGKQLIRPNTTRWNSVFDSIRRLLEFKANFQDIFKISNVENITSKEIQYLEEYLYAIQPVAFALDKLQGEATLHFGYLAPVIFQTKKRLEKIEAEKKTFASPIAKVLSQGINTRFKSIVDLDLNSQQCKMAVFAAVSHPYFKLRWIPPDKQDYIKTSFILTAKLFGRADAPGVGHSRSIDKTTTKDDAFFEFEISNSYPRQEMSDEIELECLKYLQDPSEELSMLDCYRTIRKLFVKFNTSLPSSAPVERAFSYGGLILSPNRNRLSDEMLNMLLILKTNFDI